MGEAISYSLSNREALNRYLEDGELAATCKDHGIDPFLYLRDVFERIAAHPASRIDEFLPDRWLQIRQSEGSGPHTSPAAQ